MRKLAALLPVVGIALLASCSDTTGPTSNLNSSLSPSFAKGGSGGGGVGSPHYTDGTVCTFDAGAVIDGNTGKIRCDWQLGGLAANSSGIVTLVANIQYDYFCNNIGTFFDRYRTSVRVQVDVNFYADKKGNAKGYSEATPSTSGFELQCIFGNREQESWSLDSNASPLALPLITGIGSWGLEGISTTPKGGPVYVYFSGAWTDPNVQI